MIVTLRFCNRDDCDDDSVEFRIEESAVAIVMEWYGAFYAGDDYDVFVNGRRQHLGINGEREGPVIDATPNRRALPGRKSV